MITDKRALVLSVLDNRPLREGKISDAAFFLLYPASKETVGTLIHDELRHAVETEDALALELTLYLGFHFHFSPPDSQALIPALTASWHQRHAEVVRALLTLKPRSESAVAAIYRCAATDHDYLCDDREDGIFSLATDCIYALAKIATPSAIAGLQALTESPWQPVAAKACHVMNKYGLTSPAAHNKPAE
ncbi:hypothetical protein ACUY4R_003823 [Kosakonia sp. BK9b]|uniref:hypothetical protein n=1 Tax=Kosakonia sp. TaxID=1916651 RepID=UPI00289B13AE|nr:hypothetical protein [Kosakonia sp.]